MTLLTEPTRIVLRRGWQPMDPDAAAYITAVETADGQALEEKTKIAIDNFVLGCKADGIWPAIKASCILAGARTLTGALIPLVGTVPTNFNFVAGDYNRKTGLVGNGSTKYLDSNRTNYDDPATNSHSSVFVSSATLGVTQFFMGASPEIAIVVPNLTMNRLTGRVAIGPPTVNFIGSSKTNSSGFTARLNNTSTFYSASATSPGTSNILLFAGSPGLINSNARIAFYSIGESLDLALLDARVTDLINAFAAAIP